LGTFFLTWIYQLGILGQVTLILKPGLPWVKPGPIYFKEGILLLGFFLDWTGYNT